ncbi:hypothetical protein DUI87_04013 [Hirundo rustica rustica]|uniref:Uncharacterized protein n=1 Tax=Hirundo rustica rustica TaxID=333673 RepID=A0A3M0L225_HIRRU|nr:hypothetical protein DUI87_04013 [Hirundo rustica rustica]
MKLVKGLEQNSYEQCLRDPGEKEDDVIDLYNHLKQGCSKVEDQCLSQVTSDRIRRNGLKLCQRSFRLVIRKQIFPKKKVESPGNRLPGEAVELSSPDVLKIMQLWHFRTWLSGERVCDAKLIVGLDDLKGLSNRNDL